MLKSYFTTALRHLTGHKLFSALNIFCLAIGITFSMLIGVYIIHEKKVNTNIKDIEDQYVIKSIWKQEAMGYDITTLAPLAKTMKMEYPSLVESYYRFITQNMLVSTGDQRFKEEVAICDTSLVSMFGFPLLYGNSKSVFENNKSVVVTESFAQKYFGQKNVIGKVVQIMEAQSSSDSSNDFVITAVLKDIRENTITDFTDTKMPYNLFIPFNYTVGSENAFSDWAWNGVPSFVKLKRGVKPQSLKAPLARILKSNCPSIYKGNVEIELAPLKDFYMKVNNGKAEKMVSTLTYIAAFILIMAIFNFINIVLATSGYRLKEIGLRKVFGSSKSQLIKQYLCESIVLALISIIISLGFYEWLRPLFSQLLNTPFIHIWNFGWYEILIILILIAGVGTLAGIYPSFVLSTAKITNAVKGKTDNIKDGVVLKKGLLVFQFTITIVIFITTLNISRQITYFLNKDLGYDKSGILLLNTLPNYAGNGSGLPQLQTFRDELSRISGVKTASLCYEIPNGNYVDNLNLVPEGATNGQVLSLPYLVTDENYAATFGLQMKDGRFLNHKQNGQPLDEIVINEAAAKALGWTDAVGKKVKMKMAGVWLTVVGVVKDFNFFSLRRKIEPLGFVNVSSFQRAQYIPVKFQTSNITSLVENIQNKWKSFFPADPFEYSFMDEKVESLYTTELQVKKAMNIATIMNLIIVFLGIFGVLASTLARRTKEIAVRKVVGANVQTIIWLFIKDYALLIMLANIIAWPLAYWLTGKWLEDYVYRADQNVVPYLLVLVIIFATAFLLIIAQCYKVASANLLKGLRIE